MGTVPSFLAKGDAPEVRPSLACALLLLPCARVLRPTRRYTVARGLFKQRKPDLGLRAVPNGETITIFKPQAGADQFNNGVVLIPFKGKLYAQWQSSPKDEDSQDTWVAYSVSDDGSHWSMPAVLAPAAPAPQMHSNGGWWTDGETLVAYIVVWPTGFQSGDGRLHGLHPEQRWRALVIAASHHAARMASRCPASSSRTRMRCRAAASSSRFTRGPASSWRRSSPTIRWASTAGSARRMQNLPYEGHASSRELEPSLFLRGSCAVMVFRDQASTHRQLLPKAATPAKPGRLPR